MDPRRTRMALRVWCGQLRGVQLDLVAELFVAQFADGNDASCRVHFTKGIAGNFYGHLNSDGQAHAGVQFQRAGHNELSGGNSNRFAGMFESGGTHAKTDGQLDISEPGEVVREGGHLGRVRVRWPWGCDFRHIESGPTATLRYTGWAFRSSYRSHTPWCSSANSPSRCYPPG
jgi:hypothetical protein